MRYISSIRFVIIVATVTLCGALAATSARAQTNAVQSGNWSEFATWDLGEPSLTLDANINQGFGGTPITVTIDQAGETANFVNVGSIDGQAGALTMTAGDLTTANTANSIIFGRVAGSTGTFNMSGGTISVSPGGTGGGFRDFILGDFGNATGTITGGTINVADVFFVGTTGASVSSATMSGGAINAGNDFVIGGFQGGTGTFDHSNGDVTAVDNYVVAIGPTSTGTVNQSGGNVTAAGLLVGENGRAQYNLNAGTVNVTGGGNATQDFDENVIISLTGATDDDASAFRQRGGTVNVGTTASQFPVSVFLGNFDNSNGTYHVSGGGLNVSGDLNVGAAIASNASPTRGEPTQTSAQGQALNADGTFVVEGNAATINVGRNLLANPADKSAPRNDPGEENDSVLRFVLGPGGVSTINVAGIADLDGAVIDIEDPSGFILANGQATLISAAGGFGNVYTVTAAERAGTGEGFTLAPGDGLLYSLAVVPSGAGEALIVTAVPEPASLAALTLFAAARLARRKRA